MPRHLVLGNGRLLVNFDQGLNIRDLYYPHVGWENHVGGHRLGIGVWVDGSFSWVDDRCWRRKLSYLQDTLVTNTMAVHDGLGIQLLMYDAVHFKHQLLLKKVIIRNLWERKREIRLFFSHDLSIDGTEVGDTALYEPSVNAIFHYKRNRYFLINGSLNGSSIFQYAVGTKRFRGAEGTWRDAEDGWLEGNPIAQGSVDSVVSFRTFLEPGQEEVLHYWIAVGNSFHDVKKENFYVIHNSPGKLMRKVEDYWRTWVNKKKWQWGDLPPKVQELFKRSLLVVRTQVDDGGAIIAANDSDILKEARDHYSYMWPRDGALVVVALDKAGYPEITSRFFQFCTNVLMEGGYLLHKYNPDGSVGSSWHPWFLNGKTQLPIQEDETALVIYALWNHFQIQKDLEFISRLYKPLIRKAADFMVEYRDAATGLPLESYDLWEERRGIFTFTCATVYGGLVAAGQFARLFGDLYLAERYEQAAAEIKEGMLEQLYSPSLGRFLRGVYLDDQGNLTRDFTLESSLYAVWSFGVLPPDDLRVVGTMCSIQEGLWVKTDVGGIARYTNDYYFRVSDDIETVPGNPWFICTLWLARWHIAIATSVEEMQIARTTLEWASDRAMEAGLLSEQLHPYDGSPISVAPLTWSHATFIETVVDYVNKYNQLW